jgi:hypothetical protein
MPANSLPHLRYDLTVQNISQAYYQVNDFRVYKYAPYDLEPFIYL